ncbi:MAG: ABC transporter ATP-binding protein [Alphaproteobacteria bacterium]|nr:ABC transporter ATP-binding protein [Alphaproteobacteria bacterium]
MSMAAFDSKVGARAASDPASFFSIAGVSKRFGGLQALSDVYLTIKRGEIYALIGPNGAGKSSLFNCVTGVVPADLGHVWFKGVDLAKARPHQIVAAGIARTFQAVRFFRSLRIVENVEIAYTARTQANLVDISLCLPKERDERLALRARAAALLENYAEGQLYPRRHDFPEQLSTGQQRMLEIIRTLIGNPDLILLDEPTGGLNPVWIKQVVALIRQIRDEGKTIFMIEHNMQVVLDLADRVSVLNFGEVLAEGTPTEVRNNQKVIDAYLG